VLDNVCQASFYLLSVQDSQTCVHCHVLAQHGAQHQVVLWEDGWVIGAPVMAAALLHLSQRMAKEMGGTADTIRVDPTRKIKFKDTLATLKMMAMTAAQIAVFAPMHYMQMQGKLDVCSHCQFLCNQILTGKSAGSDQLCVMTGCSQQLCSK
jgi:hypothetical protein